jgi:pyruvate formate lyase activating enzyme
MLKIAHKINKLCKNCNYCTREIACNRLKTNCCIGCGACVDACPFEAIKLSEVEYKPAEQVTVQIDSNRISVPKNITIKAALQIAGYKFVRYPEKNAIFSPCNTGGCWSCAVIANKELVRSCITAVKDGMHISTDIDDFTPKRLVNGFSGHTVGGVGTPWYLKGYLYIEAACFAAGCNFRCRQCQNWHTTYRSAGKPLTPFEASTIMSEVRNELNVNRIAISGGECTLNRKWLVEYLMHLKSMNPNTHLHVDTNGSILTQDYIDELVDAGMTDIGIDIKSLKLDTFLKITNIDDAEIAKKYLATEWSAVKYVIDNYRDKVFVGIGIPYNPALIGIDEIAEMGVRIARIDDEIQVCVLDYRPEFRLQSIKKPSWKMMREVHDILKSTGLKTVVCQTSMGYIAP